MPCPCCCHCDYGLLSMQYKHEALHAKLASVWEGLQHSCSQALQPTAVVTAVAPLLQRVCMARCLRSRIAYGCKETAALLQLLHEVRESSVMCPRTQMQDMQMHCRGKPP